MQTKGLLSFATIYYVIFQQFILFCYYEFHCIHQDLILIAYMDSNLIIFVLLGFVQMMT